jgi:beta-lactamase regulating signal transducer with metallopeptidase domain/membrane-associated protease RseP (regulator of RpoE activity)
LLLFVCGLLLCTRQPARRQRLAEWGTLAALLFGVLCLGPAWIELSYPVPAETLAAAAPAASPPVLREEPVAMPEDSTFPEEQVEPVIVELPAPSAEPVPPIVNAAPRPISPEVNGPALLFLLYAIGAAFLVARFLIGYVGLWRLVRGSRPAPLAADRLFTAMAADLPRRPRLLASRRLRVPLSCGLLRPTVIVPADWCSKGAGPQLRWVFAHELMHLRRRDAWSCLLFGLAQAVFFYLPWFWWLRRQARLCQEYVADAAAAEQPAPVEDYAQFLLQLITAPAVPLGATGVLGNSSDLFRRVTMLLKSPMSVEKCCPGMWSLAAAGGFAALAVLASGVGLRAEPVPPPTPPVIGVAAPAEEPPPAPREERKEEPRTTPAGPAKEAAQKALDKLRKALDNGADPRQIEKELMDAMQRLQQARAQQAAEEARRRADEVRRSWENVNFMYMREGRPADGRLGVRVESPTAALMDHLGIDKGKGQLITEVVPNSAAAKAGLQVNDILLQIDGKDVSSSFREFVKIVHDLKANTPTDAVVLRKGKKETIKGMSLAEVRDPFVGQRVVVVPGPQFPSPQVPMPPVRIRVGPDDGAVVTTTVRNQDRFTTRYQEGSLIMTITGKVADGKAKVSEIQVQDGRETNKYESTAKVPEQYRDKVKNLIEASEAGNLKIEVKKP